jgi:hypothetical protein
MFLSLCASCSHWRLTMHTFTFSGMNVRLRYFVRVTITRSYNTVVKEQDFAVQNSIVVRLLDTDRW